MPIVFSVAAEIFPSKIRGGMISVIASFWMVGSIYSAGFAWIMLGNDLNGHRIYPAGDWRGYALLCALPVVVAFTVTYYLVPESPRFLLHKGKFVYVYVLLYHLSFNEHLHRYTDHMWISIIVFNIFLYKYIYNACMIV